MRTLLIDMDSVICDLMTEWHRRYNEDYQDDLHVGKLSTWQSEQFVKPECGVKIYDYLKEPGLFLKLKPLPHAIEVLERLNGQFDILIVTSSVSTAFQEKEQWVEKHLPFIGKHNIIFSHRKNMIVGDLLFDDAPHNLESFHLTGRLAVAMDYPYNHDVEVPRVQNWLDFEQFVLNLDWKRRRTSMKHADVIIVGGGPAGISAAIWCDRLGLDYYVIEQAEELGGQLPSIENAFIDYPGILTRNGKELQEHFLDHIRQSEIRYALRTKLIEINEVDHIITIKHEEIQEKMSYAFLIVAAGSAQRTLGVPGEQAMWDRDEIYSATKDSPKFKEKHVAVIGGGDRALEGALLLAKAGAYVHLIHRSKHFRARNPFLLEARKQKNITIYTNTYVTSINGEHHVSAIDLDTLDDKPFTLQVEAVFVRVGVQPNSHELKGVVALDEAGYVQTNEIGLTTNPSILAIGGYTNGPLIFKCVHSSWAWSSCCQVYI
ncbi:5' nucleotidase, NT5C type [Radiobacillus deserti]|uniref:5' nucleotidase, NT5C type n=1 Tax=Radiobacillus deserti TaxID=2594883 RepID=UPI001315861B|nr:FAD-dependent oxidoreductase [Radiobacillus deserti]